MNPTAAERLDEIRNRLGEAARRSGRDPAAVRLVAVGKTFPAERLLELYRHGQRRFGENKVQEAAEKVPVLPAEMEWHMVGHLQSNKARRAARLFHWVHSLDSEKVAVRLAEGACSAARSVAVLVQVDLAGEATKSGISPDQVERFLERLSAWPELQARGLMILPPRSDHPEGGRPYFRRLRLLGESLARSGQLPDAFHLSMGMSSDFETAVEEGASLVRVGSGLFGPRPG